MPILSYILIYLLFSGLYNDLGGRLRELNKMLMFVNVIKIISLQIERYTIYYKTYYHEI